MNNQPTLFARALLLLRRRPAYAWRALRGYSLFIAARWLRLAGRRPPGF